ncbi:MAG: glutathione S-transferase [Marinomonas sp.]
MKLVIGTLSTWSLRAWMCGQLAKIECEIHAIDLSKDGYKGEVLKYSPTGLVPALVVKDLVIHDSLAITEYFNEASNGALYPESSSERALARSLCMEMHSGFMNLRSQCPFSLEAVSPLMDRNEDIQKELDRIAVIFQQARLPFMFDNAGAVDAFYAILAYRLHSYGVEFNGTAGEYQKSLLKWPLLEKAIKFSNSL